MLYTKTNRPITLRLTGIVILLIIVELGLCQVRGQNRGLSDFNPEIARDSIDTNALDSLSELGPDTTIYDVLTFADPYTLIPFVNPDLKSLTFYDPNEQWGDVNLTLGPIGSSVRDFHIGRPQSTLGEFGFGIPYQSYFFSKKDFPLMQTNRPISYVGFSPFQGQDSFIAEGYISQNIGHQGTITVGFKRYKQIDYYINQEVKASSMLAAYRYRGKNERYHGIFSYLGRFSDEEINGGIEDPTDLETFSINVRSAIPTYVTDAISRFHDYAISIDNYYKLSNADNAITLHHNIGLSYGLSKFGDRGISSIEDVEPVYLNFASDLAGIRNYNRFNHFETSADINTTLFNIIKFDGNIGYHRFALFYDQVTEETFNQLILGLKGGIEWQESLEIIGNLETSTINGQVYNLTSVNLDASVSDLIKLNAKIYRHTYPFALGYEALYLNSILQYDYDFLPQGQTGIEGRLTSDKTRTSLKIKATNLTNQVYFDENALPNQSEKSVNVFEIHASQDLQLGIFNFNNHLTYQVFDENIWGLPNFYTQHDIYLQGVAFEKALEYKFGIYGRLMQSDHTIQYQPITRAFFKTEGDGYDLYPRIDTYLNLNISRFEVFVRYQNMYSLFTGEVETHINGHPQFDHSFRLGVKWLLKD